jgi:predicted AAA+ superfamily ATPase
MTRNEGHVQGELAEFAVATDLIRNDCRVSYTHGQYKYDLVADKDDELLRIQVKKANQDNSKPWKYRIFTDRYEAGQVDLFAGYIVDQDTVFYATFEEVGSNEFRINTKGREDMITSNAERAKLLEDYTFERALSKFHEDSD